MSKKLYIGNIAWATTDESLFELFSKFGPLETKEGDQIIIVDRDSGRSKGFGFVVFENDADADKAVEELHGKEIDGRDLIVNEARPKEPRDNSRGGGYNRNSGGRKDYNKNYNNNYNSDY